MSPNVLLVSPKFNPNSFWSLQAACDFYGARCPAPPLGLITVAAMLPRDWNVRLINRNAEELTARDLDWADMVMTGGMLPQQQDTLEVMAAVRRARQADGGRRSRPDVEPRGLSRCRFPGARRSRGTHRPVHRGVAEWRAKGRVRGREVSGRCHQEPGAALRSHRRQALSPCRRAVLARLPLQLRVLRHHRALRPRSARQDQ